MLADHIESEFLGLFYIPDHSLLRRSGIKSVRPPALVERTKLKKRLVIQGNTIISVIGPDLGNLS